MTTEGGPSELSREGEPQEIIDHHTSGATLHFWHPRCRAAGCREHLYWLDGKVYHGRYPERQTKAVTGYKLGKWLDRVHEWLRVGVSNA